MGVYAENGFACELSFWWIPRVWNTDADEAAKSGAESGEPVVEWNTQNGVLVYLDTR